MKFRSTLSLVAILLSGASTRSTGAETSGITDFSINWGKIVSVNKSNATCQVVVNPMTRAGSPIHDSTFLALKSLNADYVRYVPWLPYPSLGVAELAPPKKSHTSWNFELLDPMMADFCSATEGHPRIINFSTIPQWIFKTPMAIPYPTDPNEVTWDYSQGTELRDKSGKELGDYYARLVSWYVKGGFTDENGQRHTSGLHYKIPIWEVLNEVEFEHQMSPEQYTRIYDIIVDAIRHVSPETKFMGLALALPSRAPEYFEYFLNPAHHRPNIPIDYISYHFYAGPATGESPDTWQYTFFDQADRFLATTRYIEQIRKRLSPSTKTDADELGAILPGDPGTSLDHPENPIPDRYWNAAGALFAYLYLELAKQGIDVIGESQLVGYPSQFPSVSMIDWQNGKPNARFWVLKLLRDNFGPGDRMVETVCANRDADVMDRADIAVQAFLTTTGRKILLVNRRNRPLTFALPKELGARFLATVDEASGEGPPLLSQGSSSAIKLEPFAVVVASWSSPTNTR